MDRLPLVSPESRGDTRAQKWPHPNSSPTRDETRPREAPACPGLPLTPVKSPEGWGTPDPP